MHLEAVVGAHAAAFIGRSPGDVARDAALLAGAHKAAWLCYRHRDVMPAIDALVVEAEAWGAGAPAASVHSELAALRSLPELDATTNPRLGIVLRATERLVREVPAAVRVPVAGPLAVATALVGKETLARELHGDADEARATLLAIAAKLRGWLHAIAATGARVAICEPPYSPAEIAPELFSRVVQPALNELVREARAATRHAPALLIEGDTAPIARAMCSTGAGLVACPAATDRTAFLEQAREFRDTVVRVDFAPTLWTDADWPRICATISEARGVARIHSRTILGTGALPLEASSVVIVDACNFAMSMDAWLDPQ